jgi:hypothetical protein
MQAKDEKKKEETHEGKPTKENQTNRKKRRRINLRPKLH